MDDGVETAELVDLVCDGLCLQNAGEIANDDVLRTDHLLAGLVRARGAAGVQHDPMPLLDQKLRGHLPRPSAEPVMKTRAITLSFPFCQARLAFHKIVVTVNIRRTNLDQLAVLKDLHWRDASNPR